MPEFIMADVISSNLAAFWLLKQRYRRIQFDKLICTIAGKNPIQPGIYNDALCVLYMQVIKTYICVEL